MGMRRSQSAQGFLVLKGWRCNTVELSQYCASSDEVVVLALFRLAALLTVICCSAASRLSGALRNAWKRAAPPI